MKKFILNNLSRKEIFNYFVKNEVLIFNVKKSVMKEVDGFVLVLLYVDDKGNLVNKVESEVIFVIELGRLKVVLVINIINWLDSYGDVYIFGLWKKLLFDNKCIGFYLLEFYGCSF